MSAQPGAELALEIQYGPDPSQVRTVRVGLPAGGLTAGSTGGALYLGAAGTLYQEQELTTVASGRRE